MVPLEIDGRSTIPTTQPHSRVNACSVKLHTYARKLYDGRRFLNAPGQFFEKNGFHHIAVAKYLLVVTRYPHNLPVGTQVEMQGFRPVEPDAPGPGVYLESLLQSHTRPLLR